MSGHSKWANIKNKKEKTDNQRGKVFTKIGREIAIAVKEGGSDPANNSKLRDVIAKAKASNMPNDNISRSIKKAAGELGTINYETGTYEGYGPGGVALIVEVLTDNRNRTAAAIRHIFDKYGTGLGNTGCVAWMFERKGHIVIERSEKFTEDEVMTAAIEAGADDFQSDEDCYEIFTDPNDFSAVREELEKAGYEFLSAEPEMIPNNTIEVTDEETAFKVERIVDMFEDNDDVQRVFHNALLPETEDEDDE